MFATDFEKIVAPYRNLLDSVSRTVRQDLCRLIEKSMKNGRIMNLLKPKILDSLRSHLSAYIDCVAEIDPKSSRQDIKDELFLKHFVYFSPERIEYVNANAALKRTKNAINAARRISNTARETYQACVIVLETRGDEQLLDGVRPVYHNVGLESESKDIAEEAVFFKNRINVPVAIDTHKKKAKKNTISRNKLKQKVTAAVNSFLHAHPSRKEDVPDAESLKQFFKGILGLPVGLVSELVHISKKELHNFGRVEGNLFYVQNIPTGVHCSIRVKAKKNVQPVPERLPEPLAALKPKAVSKKIDQVETPVINQNVVRWYEEDDIVEAPKHAIVDLFHTKVTADKPKTKSSGPGKRVTKFVESLDRRQLEQYIEHQTLSVKEQTKFSNPRFQLRQALTVIRSKLLTVEQNPGPSKRQANQEAARANLLQAQCDKLVGDNAVLQERLTDLTEQLQQKNNDVTTKMPEALKTGQGSGTYSFKTLPRTLMLIGEDEPSFRKALCSLVCSILQCYLNCRSVVPLIFFFLLLALSHVCWNTLDVRVWFTKMLVLPSSQMLKCDPYDDNMTLVSTIAPECASLLTREVCLIWCLVDYVPWQYLNWINCANYLFVILVNLLALSNVLHFVNQAFRFLGWYYVSEDSVLIYGRKGNFDCNTCNYSFSPDQLKIDKRSVSDVSAPLLASSLPGLFSWRVVQYRYGFIKTRILFEKLEFDYQIVRSVSCKNFRGDVPSIESAIEKCRYVAPNVNTQCDLSATVTGMAVRAKMLHEMALVQAVPALNFRTSPEVTGHASSY